MEDNNDKIQNALWAFLAIYHLEPIESGSHSIFDNEYLKTFDLYSGDDDQEIVQLQLRHQEHNHLIQILKSEFPKQVHKTKISTESRKVCRDWIENDKNINDDIAVEEAAGPEPNIDYTEEISKIW